MAVKTYRYEIIGWQGDPTKSKARWMLIADRCREIVNVIWQQWEVWHVSKGNDIIAQKFSDELRAYRRKEGEKPTLAIKSMPPELSKIIYAKLAKRFPDVNGRVRELLRNITTQRMNGKDVEGRWNIWLAVLLNRQGRPNCTHDQPIPFDAQNSTPLKRANCNATNYELEVRFVRIPGDNKTSPSITDRVQLKARKGGEIVLQRIIEQEYRFCGSSIVYNAGKRKWFALIAYDDKQDSGKVMRDPKKTATLHSTRESPWALWIDGRWSWIGGRGDYIAAARHRLLTSRWSRQENYRWAGSANKGRGRERAMEGVQKLSEGWKDFVKTCNHTVTRQVVERCIDAGVGRLIYLQPTEDKRITRFLSKAGKVPGREDSTGWDWSQVATFLAYKCKEFGIHLEVRKCNASGKKKDDDEVRVVSGASRSSGKGRAQKKAALVS